MRVNNKNRFQNEPIVCCFEKCVCLIPGIFFPEKQAVSLSSQAV
jgi:hypothetical protein